MKCRKAFTLIELMIVVIVVAILAAGAVPIYRSVISRAYETEVVTGLGVFRGAERLYRAEHGTYTDLSGLEGAGLIESADFVDMRYVTYGEFTIPDSDDDSYTIKWTRPGSGDVASYGFAEVTMDEGGVIDRDNP